MSYNAQFRRKNHDGKDNLAENPSLKFTIQTKADEDSYDSPSIHSPNCHKHKMQL